MDNSYSNTDFVEMSLNSNDEFEPYGYQANLQLASCIAEQSAQEKRIENMILSHSKYYAYYEY